MIKFTRRISITIIMLALVLSPGRAELPPLPLQDKVKLSALIVKCRAEVEGNTVKYRVVETWKGKYSSDLFYHNPDIGPWYHRPPEGYVFVHTWNKWDNSPKPKNGQEAIFFFSYDQEPEWTKDKLTQNWPSFVVTDGKIVYPDPSVPPPPPLGDRKDYSTEEEFTKAKIRRFGWAVLYGYRKEYTLEEFKKAILYRVELGKKDPTKKR